MNSITSGIGLTMKTASLPEYIQLKTYKGSVREKNSLNLLLRSYKFRLAQHSPILARSLFPSPSTVPTNPPQLPANNRRPKSFISISQNFYSVFSLRFTSLILHHHHPPVAGSPTPKFLRRSNWPPPYLSRANNKKPSRLEFPIEAKST
ncbi:hypothetical protein KFK09_002678 [Dendrobium nobile]|uniref:Uncharacterized protein n=1 Tax=Dendrobium nobile TaxID=94219 RepID=A0A8T3C712_DENNO|nr:hypothetical protein KFK09_002678 [Dendrobium nobile]